MIKRCEHFEYILTVIVEHDDQLWCPLCRLKEDLNDWIKGATRKVKIGCGKISKEEAIGELKNLEKLI